MIIDFMTNASGQEAIISGTACEKVVVLFEDGHQRTFRNAEAAHKKLVKMGYMW